jgi:hypothetical protein
VHQFPSAAGGVLVYKCTSTQYRIVPVAEFTAASKTMGPRTIRGDHQNSESEGASGKTGLIILWRLGFADHRQNTEIVAEDPG